MDVSIITVSYNTADLIAECIESAFTQTGVTYEHILVDNNSPDNSQTVIRAFEPRVHLIANPVNAGFGRANNLGTKCARGKYLYLMNPDAHFIEPITLKKLVDHLEKHPECALVGTPLLDALGQNTAEPNTSYPHERHCKQQLSGLPGNIAWVIGASMLIRKTAFDAIGGFDEDFFLYSEETDLCLRLRKAGYTVGYLETAPVSHVGAASERTTGIYSYIQKKQQGLFLFFTKHYSHQDIEYLLNKQYRRTKQSYRRYSLLYFVLRQQRHHVKMERDRAILDSILQYRAIHFRR